jgi:hypothetical protein
MGTSLPDSGGKSEAMAVPPRPWQGVPGNEGAATGASHSGEGEQTAFGDCRATVASRRWRVNATGLFRV